MLRYVSILHSFSLLNNIPLYGYTIFSLSIHPLVNIWTASTFFFWHFEKYYYGHSCTRSCRFVFSLFQGIYLGVNLLGHMVTMVTMFNIEELPDCFPKHLHYFTFPPAMLVGTTFFFFFLQENLCIYICNFV